MKKFKHIVAIVAVVIVSLFASLSYAQERHSAVIKKVTSKEIKAMMDSTTGPTIVNFWASWCGPCIREIHWFDSIIAAKNVTVNLLLVSLDFPSAYPTKLTAFVKSQGYKGHVVYLAETNSQLYIPVIEKTWSGVIPASIFIDNSKKYYQVFNHQLTKERFAIELDKMMK